MGTKPPQFLHHQINDDEITQPSNDHRSIYVIHKRYGIKERKIYFVKKKKYIPNGLLILMASNEDINVSMNKCLKLVEFDGLLNEMMNINMQLIFNGCILIRWYLKRMLYL